MRKVYYYVGSNNKTRKLEVEKIEAVLARHFQGFTTYEVAGYWKGQRERTLKVEVVTEEQPAKLTTVARELAHELEQQSVLMEIVESNFAFVQSSEREKSVLELAASLW